MTGPFVKKYSTSSHSVQKLNPYWVTGFSSSLKGSGEACFSVDISRAKDHKLGWKITPIFSIGLHSNDLDLIKKIQSFFNGAGKIYLLNNSEVVYFRIKSVKDLAQYVIPHFDKYPLLTQKRADFLLFKQVIDLMLRKEHLTSKGLLDIVSLKAFLNLGLSEDLKKAFPNIVLKNRPEVEFKAIEDPHWIAGFASSLKGSGESCFFVEKSASKTHKLGYQVRLKFILSQDSRDIALLNLLKDYFNCGDIKVDSLGMCRFIIRKNSDITSFIIPFFAKYPLHGSKYADYTDFCKVAKLMESKAHLTVEGLEEINRIKSGMNRGRR